MNTPNEEAMTTEQKEQIHRLCHKAKIPDKSGELLTRKQADEMIADLMEKVVEMGETTEIPRKPFANGRQ
jgi:hypothetical protein